MVKTQIKLGLRDSEVRSFEARHGACSVAHETVLRRTELSIVPREEELVILTKGTASVNLHVTSVYHVIAYNDVEGHSHRCEIVCRVAKSGSDATVDEITEVLRLKD